MMAMPTRIRGEKPFTQHFFMAGNLRYNKRIETRERATTKKKQRQHTHTVHVFHFIRVHCVRLIKN